MRVSRKKVQAAIISSKRLIELRLDGGCFAVNLAFMINHEAKLLLETLELVLRLISGASLVYFVRKVICGSISCPI